MTTGPPAGAAVRPPLSVVVATRDRPDQLERCLRALQAALSTDDEIVVVDSASRDRRTHDVATAAGATCLRVDRPGTSRARNTGWLAAAHQLVAFTDDDVEVSTTWADAMAAALTESSWVTGWVGVRDFGPGSHELNPLVLAERSTVLDARHRGSFGASANFGAHRDVLRLVGGFDERFGPGTWTSAAEDVELFDRLIAAGLTGRYEPDVRVIHEQWRGRGDATSLHWRYGKGMGARLALLARRDRRRALRSAREVTWDEGVVAATRCLRQGYELGALVALLRVVATIVGFVAWTVRR